MKMQITCEMCGNLDAENSYAPCCLAMIRDQLRAALSDAQAQLAQSEAGAAAMREALGGIEAFGWNHSPGDLWSNAQKVHAIAKLAIASPSGTAMLRRVEAGENLYSDITKVTQAITELEPFDYCAVLVTEAIKVYEATTAELTEDELRDKHHLRIVKDGGDYAILQLGPPGESRIVATGYGGNADALAAARVYADKQSPRAETCGPQLLEPPQGAVGPGSGTGGDSKQTPYLTEIIRIINGGLHGEPAKVRAFAKELSRKMGEVGDDNSKKYVDMALSGNFDGVVKTSEATRKCPKCGSELRQPPNDAECMNPICNYVAEPPELARAKAQDKPPQGHEVVLDNEDGWVARPIPTDAGVDVPFEKWTERKLISAERTLQSITRPGSEFQPFVYQEIHDAIQLAANLLAAGEGSRLDRLCKAGYRFYFQTFTAAWWEPGEQDRNSADSPSDAIDQAEAHYKQAQETK